MRDFVFSVLHCADDFLRQDILEKMAACQLAVPIILQGIEGTKPQFLLWALRRIIKKWKGNRDSYASEQLIATYPIFTVSVLRIGDVRVSKSSLLNTMLGYSQGNSLHSFFLSMEKDIVKPHFSVGSIECVWFLPQYGNDDEIFQEVTAFFNLRGDCTKHQVQTEFACKAADLTIALISTGKRDKYINVIKKIMINASKTLFVAIKEEDKHMRTQQKVYNPQFKDGWLFVKVLQVDVLSRHICKHISLTNPNPNQYRSLESLANICRDDIDIDENKWMCKNAKKSVHDIFESVSLDNIIEFKKVTFPLQDYWLNLVQLDEEPSLSDGEGESLEDQRKAAQIKKVTVREEQMHASLSEPIKRYHSIVSSNKNNSKMLKYIFGYLQDFIYRMVNKSTQNDFEKVLDLEEQIQSYKRGKRKGDTKKFSEEISNSKHGSTAESACESQQCALKYLTKQCKAKNLGCEHFLRELGQRFEAYKEAKVQEPCEPNMADMSLLPALAARLVTEMHSLELMDGDAGSVPLVWITNVLDTLTNTLGDPKVFVISAIGVQSSGKSTLLNSMFGLKFPVRAGRCTRGLFIRLIQLEESLVEELGLQYLLIVDTEGVQSVGHEGRRFDNELVTLALGIANFTIFNIEGENIGPDMTGILQIAAHALMRMKEVDIECQCRIVQQRVSDLTAADRNKANNDIILETLDEATKLAAEEEGLKGRYQRFCHVVNLHVDQGLQYIPCLWSGGMTPPNQMYSEIVTKIKAKLIQDIRDKVIIPDMTMSTFTDRVRDVWQAVKKEHFIFNFQDSVKAVDYNRLCLKYNDWILHMRHQMMLATESCYAVLDGQIDKVLTIQLTDEHNVESTKDDDETKAVDIEEMKAVLNKEAVSQEQQLIRSIEDYIEKHPRKNTVLRYKEGFIHDLTLVVRDVENQASASVQDEYELTKIRYDIPKFRSEWRFKLSYKAKMLASSVSDDAEDRSILFDENWNVWMTSVANSSKLLKTNVSLDSLQGICEKLLLRITRGMAVGSEVKHLLTEEGGIDKHWELCDCRRYIHDKFVRAWLMQSMDEKIPRADFFDIERKQALLYVQEVIDRNHRQMIDGNRGKSFDVNTFQLMLQRALKELTGGPKFKLPNALIAKGLLHLSNKAFKSLQLTEDGSQCESTFLLQVEKDAIFDDFLAFIHKDNTKIATRAAESIYYFIKPIYKQKTVQTLTSVKEEFVRQNDLIDKLRICRPWDILRWIIEREGHNFGYLIGLLGSKLLYDVVLEEKFQKIRQKFSSILDSKIHEIVNHLIEMINDIDSTSKSGPFLNWLCKLSTTTDCLALQTLYSLYEIENVDEVSDILKSIIKERLFESLLQSIEEPIYLSFCIHGYSLNFGNICDETCPLCGVPCDNPFIRHIEHSSFLHRPRGYKGETYPETKKLIIEDCTASVASKTATFICNDKYIPCQAYQSVHPNWHIKPTSTNYGLKFWQWSMARGNDLLAVNFKCEKADIPSAWYSIDKKLALQSLDLDQEAKVNGRQKLSNTNFSDIDLS